MFAVTMAAILVTMALALARAVRGPSVYDRILGVNMAGTKTVLLIAVLGFLTDRPEFLDLALIYVFLNFITTIAVLKFVEREDFAVGDSD
ncbi:MAG: monovalent cation/H+ antiporter complex subunit F [Candidatus Latescibacterota bacterium]|nr:monovalent cation/H+ antiporter complex subunit F [Candidatus Latescibacterota bacterium]